MIQNYSYWKFNGKNNGEINNLKNVFDFPFSGFRRRCHRTDHGCAAILQCETNRGALVPNTQGIKQIRNGKRRRRGSIADHS